MEEVLEENETEKEYKEDIGNVFGKECQAKEDAGKNKVAKRAILKKDKIGNE